MKFSGLTRLNDEWEEGAWLFVLNAGKVPPHLGLMLNNSWYSLKANGQFRVQEGTLFLKMIEQKNLPLLAFKLATIDLPEVESVFLKNTLISPRVSCLRPLKEVFSDSWGIDFSAAKLIFDLMPMLQREGKIIESRYRNLGTETDQNGEFTMNPYRLEDVQNRINQLMEKPVYVER